MKTLVSLSNLYNQLRNAVMGRGTKPLPGIDPQLATRVVELVERFRRWAEDQPPLINAEDYDQWEAEYVRARAALGARGTGLPELQDPNAPGPVERTLGNASSLAWGLAALVALWAFRRK